ncbi:MAG: PaaI family thioesterase [Anaerolineae bacterium]|nr:PaaI family thioesterase [Anaerolineae bacterium]
MNDVQAIIGNDRFARAVGIELLEVGDGRARARLQITERHLNGLDMVHGAAIYSLADLVFAAAANSQGATAVAINVNISYVKAVRGGLLYAEGEPVAVSRRIGTYAIRVTDEAGELVATFQGMAYRRPPAEER